MDDDVERRESLAAYRAARMPQFVAAISACIGAVEVGAILGYSSPAGLQLTSRMNSTTFNATEGIHLFDDTFFLRKRQMAWVSSVVSLGALWGGLMGGTALNVFGRRGTMLLSLVPAVIGWLLIALAVNFPMLLAGRIGTGVFVGLTCVSVNTYIGEIASSDIRGTLGSGFQLMVNAGFLVAYSFGIILDWYYLAFLCISIPLLFTVAMFFNKESPVYLLSKGRDQEALESLKFLRGPNYPVQSELRNMRLALHERNTKQVHFTELFLTPHLARPFMVSVTLMFFQQFSGANAVLFNLSTIFKSAGTDIPESLSSVIVGIVFILGTFLSSIVIDKIGRKVLLSISAGMMCISHVGLGYFFYQLDYAEKWTLETIPWLPLLALVVFMFGFAIGFAPVPWLMMGELFSSETRELASSMVTAANWFFSFVVTVTFEYIQIVILDFGAYWMYATICMAALVFSACIVKETKGKDLEQIMEMFGGPKVVMVMPQTAEARTAQPLLS
ncbi:facilitated trehalose transporter Tret1 [Hyalella azteca]|uniref:Facilitated trehalose transporter Tret1 n=1 Tax=Hyalella azteca TaxID=294128 RepID=A0A8B7P156_HYAAZ|nr:facilitated trehalose transporter Tret1 [Hyalella azteca]